MTKDKAGKTYWDHAWEKTLTVNAVDPHLQGINNHVNRIYHDYFVNIFSGLQTEGKKLLEIGCARSQWLPYFAKEFGFKVAGIDYSEAGCLMAREILSNAGIEGEVVCTDFFNHPQNMLGDYDVVVSFGVVEHFESTTDCLNAFTKYLTPGGIIITIIPNMTGTVGMMQKILNRAVYDKHVPLDCNMLRKAHELAGVKALTCNYFVSNHFGVINLEGLDPRQISTRIKAFFLLCLRYTFKAIWKLEEVFGELPPSKLMSPFIICSGKNPNPNNA